MIFYIYISIFLNIIVCLYNIPVIIIKHVINPVKYDFSSNHLNKKAYLNKKIDI